MEGDIKPHRRADTEEISEGARSPVSGVQKREKREIKGLRKVKAVKTAAPARRALPA
jgi:hypothetical protein